MTITKPKTLSNPEWVPGACACGAVTFEIQFPARWAWHDHGGPSRRAHAAAYATYVGSWRKRFRLTGGEEALARFRDDDAATTRSFCARCGTPLFYERDSSPHMINIPRALFAARVGREPRYHAGLTPQRDWGPDWAYHGEPLKPLKGYPGIQVARPRKRKAPPNGMF